MIESFLDHPKRFLFRRDPLLFDGRAVLRVAMRTPSRIQHLLFFCATCHLPYLGVAQFSAKKKKPGLLFSWLVPFWNSIM
jgi:hypothetical protein